MMGPSESEVPPMEETLGKRIVRNRKRLGLTQDALAEKFGCHRPGGEQMGK